MNTWVLSLASASVGGPNRKKFNARKRVISTLADAGFDTRQLHQSSPLCDGWPYSGAELDSTAVIVGYAACRTPWRYRGEPKNATKKTGKAFRMSFGAVQNRMAVAA